MRAAAGQAVGVRRRRHEHVLARSAQEPPFLASAGGYQLMVGNDKDSLATRVSYKLDLRGPSITVQTACSTSLVAVLASRALLRGDPRCGRRGGPFPQRGGYLFEEG